MLLLAGVLGMMAVGGTAFYGFDLGQPNDDDPDVPLPAQTGPDDGGSDLLDSVRNDTTSDDPEGDHDANVENKVQDQSADDPGGALSQQAYQPGEIIAGAEGDDALTGTSGDDQINGYADYDLISGLGGDDTLHGDSGADTLDGGDGADVLHGEEDDDSLSGGDGADSLYGHGGQDSLAGGMGQDSLVGGEGHDTLTGGDGADALHGGLGDDTLEGGLGADTLFGGWGNDALTGVVDDPDTPSTDDMDDADFLNGGGGDDLIVAGKDDIVSGGGGADTFALGHWLTQPHQAEITDFSSDEDVLMVIYDDTVNPDPDIALESDPDDPDRQHVLLNGMGIASVAGPDMLTLGHITLVAESSLPTPTPL